MKTAANRRLGERELDIMRVLWQCGPATVTEVHQTLLHQGHKVAYTTIQTMLNRLEAKRYVARDDTDRAHRYRPLLKEPTAVSSAIARLTQRFFSGSVEALATQLVEKELSSDQLKRIQGIIEAHRVKGPSK